MSDLLAVFGAADEDHELLDGIAAYRPDRVTVLVQDEDAELLDEDSGAGQALRDRVAALMACIEGRTAATVVGLAGQRSQLDGWRFDRELAAHEPIAA